MRVQEKKRHYDHVSIRPGWHLVYEMGREESVLRYTSMCCHIHADKNKCLGILGYAVRDRRRTKSA